MDGQGLNTDVTKTTPTLVVMDTPLPLPILIGDVMYGHFLQETRKHIQNIFITFILHIFPLISCDHFINRSVSLSFLFSYPYIIPPAPNPQIIDQFFLLVRSHWFSLLRHWKMYHSDQERGETKVCTKIGCPINC